VGVSAEEAIASGLRSEAAEATRLLLESVEPLDIISGHLMPALEKVGADFEADRIYLPQLLASASAAQEAFAVVREQLARDGTEADGPPVVLATVKGDVHDIGKNIVKVILQNYGFRVVDLGRDVAPDAVVDAVQISGAKLVGLSALMTTTLVSMEETIAALRAAGSEAKVMVGGAVLTQAYADSIGADHYGKDASSAAHYAQELHATP
jgi:5-methyltetrahydrofolate--homocysteine methyltransferase